MNLIATVLGASASSVEKGLAVAVVLVLFVTVLIVAETVIRPRVLQRRALAATTPKGAQK